MNARSIKPLAALALTAAGSALVVGFRPADASTVAAVTGGTTLTSAAVAAAPTAGAGPSGVSATTTAGATTATGPSGAASGTTSATTGTVAAATLYADGTWKGSSVQEPWGAFQVQAVVSGGKITSISVIASPSDSHSSRINSSAIPKLTSAALAKQSAAVDLVSGATWTSNSYKTSLQAALDKAKAARPAA
jgi:uncharacterized protein with FMN-binding domain